MLTQEKIDILIGVFNDNPELLRLNKDDTLTGINKLGHSFTSEELEEFTKDASISWPDGQMLDYEQLDSVAGGSLISITINWKCPREAASK